MDFFMNGEIYIKKDIEENLVYEIKKGLTPFIRLDGKKLLFLTNEILFTLTNEAKERLYLSGILIKVKKIDYTPNRGFYTFYSDGNTFYQVNPLMNVIEKYNSLEEMQKHFIKLSEFLSLAEYVGKIFERKNIGRSELIYQYKELYLMRVYDGYISFRKDDPILNEYQITNEETAIYDKDELFKTICHQEMDLNKNGLIK